MDGSDHSAAGNSLHPIVVNCCHALFLNSLMFGAYSKDSGPSLYMIEPSGVSWVWPVCMRMFVSVLTTVI